MNPWYQILEENCYIEHDKLCEKGVDCFTRDNHVRRHYIPQALKHRVERLQFENKELRDKIDRIERAFDRHNIEGLLPEHYFREALNGER